MKIIKVNRSVGVYHESYDFLFNTNTTKMLLSLMSPFVRYCGIH